MHAPGTHAARDRTGSLVLVAWGVIYVTARLAVEALPAGSTLGIAAALLPIPFFALVIRSLIRRIGRLDELQRRIHLEALVVAFPLAVMLLMLLGLLDLVIDLSPADWSFRHIWPMLILFYCVGYLVARRRYE